MSVFSDAELAAMSEYGGPAPVLARSLLADLSAARATVRKLETSIARPAVAAAILEADRKDLVERQAAERAAFDMGDQGTNA